MTYAHFSIKLSFKCVFICLLLISSLAILAQDLPDEKIVDFNLPEVNLRQALDALSDNTGVNITYSPEDLPSETRVTIVANNLNLGIVLEDILTNTNLTYQIIGNQLVVFKRPDIVENKNVRVDGFVTDLTSGEKLVFANVFTDDFKYGTSTNEYGYFTLDVPMGENILVFSYLGYDKTVQYLKITQDTTIEASLNSNILLNEIVIIGQAPKKAKDLDISDRLPIQNINSLPNLAGEPDIMRLATLRPGVVTSADGLGGISVRGGSVDQNLILYDGVPVYNTGHALGIFSIFNSSVVKSANLIKGGFSAKYGGRLSSVLDVRTREGNNKEFAGDISISPLAARATIEGPIKKEKSSFIISARRTIVDPWLKPISEFRFDLSNESGFINYYFYDFSAKMNVQLGKKDHIYFSGHLSKDQYSAQTDRVDDSNGQDVFELDRTNWNWGNDLATFRWNHIYSNKLFSNLTFSYSQFDFEFFDFDKTTIGSTSDNQAVGYLASLFDSNIEDLIANIDLEYKPSSKWNVLFGSNYTRHNFSPGVIFSTTRDDLLGDKEVLVSQDLSQIFTAPEFKGHELRSYIENEIQVFPWLKANVGAHFSLITNDNDQKTYTDVQPRALIKANFGDKSSLKLSFTRMNQYLHLLSNAGIGLPNDVWVPSTSNIPPQEADQYSAELAFELLKGTKVTLSPYYKELTNLRTFKDGAIFGIRDGAEWEQELPEGSGKAYGAEFSIEKTIGKVSGWANYTWSKSTRIFPELNSGKEFFASHDRRHSINVASVINLGTNFDFSMQWTYGTGSPYTAPTSISEVIVDNNVETTFLYGDRNNARFPDYHRLDMAVNFYNDYNWGKQKIAVGLYNVYNKKNPFYIDFVRDRADTDVFTAEAVSIFPIVPNVTYSLSF